MYQTSSIHTGEYLVPSIPRSIWLSNNEGYTCSVDKVPEYRLAKEYIDNELKISSSYFEHKHDCWYGVNNSHVELRGSHRYLRPSLCAKFILKSGMKKFYENDWSYGYHGTTLKNVKSILENGLKKAGDKLKDGTTVPQTNGGAYGPGVYSSKLPQYSSLYCDTVEYKGKFLQFIFLVRLNPIAVECGGAEGKVTKSMLGRDDIYKLYNGVIEEEETQFVVRNTYDVLLQGLLVRVLDRNPIYGEYVQIRNMLEEIDRKKIGR